MSGCHSEIAEHSVRERADVFGAMFAVGAVGMRGVRAFEGHGRDRDAAAGRRSPPRSELPAAGPEMRAMPPGMRHSFP